MSLPRNRPDYLDHFARLSRRVRDLETGVHPVSARWAYNASVPVTNIAANPAVNAFVSATGGTGGVNYRKRMGIASLVGGAVVHAGAAGFPAGGSLYGFVPNGSRPSVDMMFRVAAVQVPYHARIAVLADGSIIFFKDDLAGDVTVRIDTASWPVA